MEVKVSSGSGEKCWEAERLEVGQLQLGGDFRVNLTDFQVNLNLFLGRRVYLSIMLVVTWPLRLLLSTYSGSRDLTPWKLFSLFKNNLILL